MEFQFQYQRRLSSRSCSPSETINPHPWPFRCWFWLYPFLWIWAHLIVDPEVLEWSYSHLKPWWDYKYFPSSFILLCLRCSQNQLIELAPCHLLFSSAALSPSRRYPLYWMGRYFYEISQPLFLHNPTIPKLSNSRSLLRTLAAEDRPATESYTNEYVWLILPLIIRHNQDSSISDYRAIPFQG